MSYELKPQFTWRQDLIIRLLFMAYSNQEIANYFEISLRTVKIHLKQIAWKLRIDTAKFYIRGRIVWLLRGRYA